MRWADKWKRLSPGAKTAVVLPAVVLACAAVALGLNAIDKRGVSPSPSVVSVAVDYRAFMAEYAANPVAADVKYLYKRVLIRRVPLNHISQLADRMPFVASDQESANWANGQPEYGRAGFSFAKGDSGAAKLRSGQWADIEGVCRGRVAMTALDAVSLPFAHYYVYLTDSASY